MKESLWEFLVRWHLYRRWKPRVSGTKKAYAMLASMLLSAPKDSVFLDLGANVGDVTRWAVQRGMRVIAFEPDPVALAVLRKRFGRHPRVRIIPNAVGSTDRTTQLYRSRDVEQNIRSTIASSLFDSVERGGGPTVAVEVTDITKFIRELDSPIAIIKMDIEGAEAECMEAILGAGIHRQVQHILVETHEVFGPEFARRIGAIRKQIADEKIQNVNLDWV